MEADGKAWQFNAAHDSEDRQDILPTVADSGPKAEASVVLDLKLAWRDLSHPQAATDASSPH